MCVENDTGRYYVSVIQIGQHFRKNNFNANLKNPLKANVHMFHDIYMIICLCLM